MKTLGFVGKSVLIIVISCLGIYHIFNNKEEKISGDFINLEKIVKEEIDNMSLEEKIGQMLIVSFKGTSLTEELKTEFTTYQPGGVIFFKDNVSTYENTLKLVNDIEATAKKRMFISLDQEGGKVQRIKNIKDFNVSTIPDMQTVGKVNDPDLTYELGKVMGKELRVFGFNMDFAPVLDIVKSSNNKVIGNRSFGSNANLVTTHGLALARGLNDTQVIPVYKHFPGHGSTTTDSHYNLPVLKETKEELFQENLIPFQKAIANGAKVIMVGHLAIPNITKDNTPASLSKEIITDLLKNELGFNGLVVTDALNMNAITDNYSEKEIYEMAINAGVDLLLMPKSCESAVSLIKESIKEGKIREEQIDNSVKKILILKKTELAESKLNPSDIDTSWHEHIIEAFK